MFSSPVLKYIFRFGGPIALLGALWLYYELTQFETQGGTYRSHVLIIWLYKTFGKWGVVGTLLVVSAGYFFLSIRHYLLKRNGKVVNGKNPRGMDNMWC